MPAKLEFFGRDKSQIFDVSVPELIELIWMCERGIVALSRNKLVLIHAIFNGGWYSYITDDFLERCAAFVRVPGEFHDKKLLKEIFDIFETKTLKTNPVPAGESPKEPTVVFDGADLAGIWMNYSVFRLGVIGTYPSFPGERMAQSFGKDLMRRALPKEVPLRRNPHLISDKEYCPAVGDEIKATVYCDTTPSTLGEIAEELSISGPAYQDEFNITVFLSPGEGLSVRGDATKTLKVYRSQEKSEPVSFPIFVDKPPPGTEVELNAYFFYRGRPCGRVTRILSAIPGIEPAQRPGKLSAEEGTPVDLTVTVTRKAGTAGAYDVTLSSPHDAALCAPELWDLGQDSQTFLRGLFAVFIAKQEDPTVRIAELRGAGEELFKRAPENFRNAHDRLSKANQLKTILAVSEEPYIPWELMIPPATLEERANGQKKEPLGVAHAIGRWVTSDNTSPPSSKQIKRAIVVAPDYSIDGNHRQLVNSPNELAHIKGLFPVVPAISPSTRSMILQNLASDPPDLFHFVGHGNSSTAKFPCLYLEKNEELSPNNVKGEPIFQKAFAKGRPLVFLNACEIGQQTLAFGGPAGFVPTFIDLFASGVVAPLWSVRDSIAYEIAKELYDEAFARKIPIAEVLRCIRRKAYEGATGGEDSYAAYCFFGDPNFFLTKEEVADLDLHVMGATPAT